MRTAGHHDSLTVPQSVTAPSRQALRFAMLKINREMNARVIFQDIQQIEERGVILWCAWYYERIEMSEAEVTDGST